MDTKNVVSLVGRLVADPELKYLDSGKPVGNFAIAVNRSVRQPDGSFEDSLDGFFDCELWGGEAVTLAETCRKGTLVQLSGSLFQQSYKSRGDQPRTIRRIVIRVSSIATVVRPPKKDSLPDVAAAAPAAQAPSLPQHA